MAALTPTPSLSGFNTGAVSPQRPFGTTNQSNDSSSSTPSSSKPSLPKKQPQALSSDLVKPATPISTPAKPLAASSESPKTDSLSKQTPPTGLQTQSKNAAKNKELQLQSPLLINGHPPHITPMTIAGTALTLAIAMTVFPVKIVRNLLGGLGAAFLVVSYLVNRMRYNKAHNQPAVHGQSGLSDPLS